MKYLYKFKMTKILSKKLFFVWFVLIIFNLDNRINGSLEPLQFIVESLSNQYYIIYFMIPMFLLIIISNIDEEGKYELIRKKTYWNYFKSKIHISFIYSIIFVLSQFLLIICMSIGLKGNRYQTNLSQYEALQFYNGRFSNLIEPIIYIVSYMTLGFIMMSLFIYTINHFLKKNTVIKIIIVTYLISFISIKINSMPLVSILFLNTYIILHHGIRFGFGISINLLIEVLFIILICIVNKNYWNVSFDSSIKKLSINKYKKNHGKYNINGYYTKKIFSKYNMLSIIFVLIIMCIWKFISSNKSISLNQYIINVFSGTLIGEKNPLVILEMLVLNLMPIYLLSIFIESESSFRTSYVNIRLKTSLKWFNSIISIAFSFIFIYTIINILVPILLGTMLNLKYDASVYQLILLIFIIKMLNSIFEFLILFSIYRISKNITFSFFSIIILNLITMFPFKLIYYIPFGISSLYRYSFILNQYGINYGLRLNYVIIELLILNIIIFIYLKRTHKKLIVH